MINRRTLLAGTGLLALWQLSGCATVVPESDLRFASRGRFTLALTDASGKRENLSGKFSFKRTDRYTRLDLLTPLNGVLARIELKDGLASFSRDPNEEPLSAPDVETLMTETVGFSMPVTALEEWALSTGTPTGYGWNVRVLKREAGLPKTLRAERAVRESSVRITIVFDEVSL